MYKSIICTLMHPKLVDKNLFFEFFITIFVSVWNILEAIVHKGGNPYLTT